MTRPVEHVISNRAIEIIDFNAHDDAILRIVFGRVVFFIEKIGFDQLDRVSEIVVGVSDMLNKHLAVSNQSIDDQVL